MNTYYIRAHVHFAIAADAVVFMDLRSDQYSMLTGGRARIFLSMLHITEGSIQEVIAPTLKANSADSFLQREVLCELMRYHLVTDNRANAAISPSRIAFPDQGLPEPDETDTHIVRAIDAWRFMRSCLVTSWLLRFHSISGLVRSLQLRKQRARTHNTKGLAGIRRLVLVYNRLRPLFPRNYLCLFDSISLLEFLSLYHYHPDIVFAVKLDPWNAHCWLQYGTVALNEDLAEACTYLPIMSA